MKVSPTRFSVIEIGKNNRIHCRDSIAKESEKEDHRLRLLTVSLLSASFVIRELLFVKSSSWSKIFIAVLLMGIMLFRCLSVGKIRGGNSPSPGISDEFGPLLSIALPLT